MKRIALVCLCVSILLCAVGCASSSDVSGGSTTLNVLNWGEYMDPTLITRFEEETGISLNYTTCPDNETMYSIISSPGSKIDIVFPSEYMVQKMYEEGLLAEVDYSKIPNAKNIMPIFAEQGLDVNQEYAVPYTWGTLGILYNTDMVTAEEASTWNVLWDEKFDDQIYMYDSMRDSYAVAMFKLGYDSNTKNEDEIVAATEALTAQKPLVKAYGTDDIRVSMLNGSGALGVVYSGDATRALLESDNLAYSIPSEGSNVWFDYMVLTEASQNKDAAYKFMDFLCDVEVATINAEYIGYSSPIAGVIDNLDPEYADLTSYNPADDILARCESFEYLGEAEQVYGKYWMEIKSR